MIDGDRLLFSRSLIEQGYQGGRQAAQDFTKAIALELVQQGLTGFDRLSFWVTIYLNKRAVLTTLQNERIATQEQFEGFLVGFGQASPRFVIMDAGPGRESTEAKVKGACAVLLGLRDLRIHTKPMLEYVKTYIRFPQTLRVFMGGKFLNHRLLPPLIVGQSGIDDGYLNMYGNLEEEDLAGKLVLLQVPKESSPAVRHMAVRSIHLDGLFMEERLGPGPIARPGPLTAYSDSNMGMGMGLVTNSGLISPQSESQGSMPTPPPAHRSPDHFKQVDPSKVSTPSGFARYLGSAC